MALKHRCVESAELSSSRGPGRWPAANAYADKWGRIPYKHHYHSKLASGGVQHHSIPLRVCPDSAFLEGGGKGSVQSQPGWGTRSSAASFCRREGT